MYLTWLYYGSDGLSQRIGHAFARAEQFYSLLEQSDDIVMISTRPLPCLQVCFYYAPNGVVPAAEESTNVTQEIVRRLVGRGFMVDYAPGERGKFLRIVVHPETTSETVQRLFNSIMEVGVEVTGRT